MSSINKWGNITWTLFHVIAEKIDKQKFNEIRQQLIDILYGICRNLPCPICSKDAINILNKEYLRNITTKEHFIEFLRQFHNIVNIKLKKPQVSINEYQTLYVNKNIGLIIKNFYFIYNQKYNNSKLMVDTFHKLNYLKILSSQLNSIKYAIL